MLMRSGKRVSVIQSRIGRYVVIGDDAEIQLWHWHQSPLKSGPEMALRYRTLTVPHDRWKH